jgi:hypothetical protein
LENNGIGIGTTPFGLKVLAPNILKIKTEQQQQSPRIPVPKPLLRFSP